MTKKQHLWESLGHDMQAALKTDPDAYIEGLFSVPAELDAHGLVEAHNISAQKPNADVPYIIGRVVGASLAHSNYRIQGGRHE